jgi:hypothetical protein
VPFAKPATLQEPMVFQAGTVADLAHRDLMTNESVRIAGLENTHALDFTPNPYLPRVVYNEDGFTSVANPPGAHHRFFSANPKYIRVRSPTHLESLQTCCRHTVLESFSKPVLGVPEKPDVGR